MSKQNTNPQARPAAVAAPKPKHFRPVKKWSMYPNLHDEVSRLLKASNLNLTFYNKDIDDMMTKSKDTNIMGTFRCHNQACPKKVWTSKKIAIFIRLYDNQYNARVYHQRCQSCNRLSRPKLDDSYAARIAYRLKKWHGVPVESPNYNPNESNLPHDEERCEGCRDGHCQRGQF